MDDYISAAELQTAIGFQAATMATLTPDGEGDTEGAAFTEALESVISDQTDFIDAWIIGKVDDLEDLRTNQILRRICLNLSKYEMFSRFARDMVPDAVKADKDEAMKLLEKIQRGELELLAEAPEELGVSEFEEGQAQVLNAMLW